MKPKISDYIRWVLSLIWLFVVKEHTNVWVFISFCLILIESETQSLLNRMQSKINHELQESLLQILSVMKGKIYD